MRYFYVIAVSIVCVILLMMVFPPSNPENQGIGTLTLSTEIPKPTVSPTKKNTLAVKTSNSSHTPTPTVAVPDFLDSFLQDAKITKLHSNMYDRDLSINNKNVYSKFGDFFLIGKDYSGGIEKKSLVHEGEGIIFDFKISETSETNEFEFETYFDVGSWMHRDYRRFGVYMVEKPEQNYWQGATGYGHRLAGDLTISPNTWYRLFMGIGNNGNFLCVIWDPDSPSKSNSFFSLSKENWKVSAWKFVINGASGTMVIDNFMDITFDSFVQ